MARTLAEGLSQGLQSLDQSVQKRTLAQNNQFEQAKNLVALKEAGYNVEQQPRSLFGGGGLSITQDPNVVSTKALEREKLVNENAISGVKARRMLASSNSPDTQGLPPELGSYIDPGTGETKVYKKADTVGKQNALDQKSWEKIVKATDPGAASSRTSFGIASSGNAKADRALDSLKNNKIFTNQDLQNALADVDSIYQGGAPSDSAMKRGDYESIRQKLAGMQQFISGKPTDAVPPQIRQHIIDNLTQLKATNKNAIKQHFDFYEKAQPNIIKKNQDAWTGMKNSYLGEDIPSVPAWVPQGYDGFYAQEISAGTPVDEIKSAFERMRK